MRLKLTKHEKRLIRLTNGWADLLYAKQAYQLFMTSPSEGHSYHFLLSMVICYFRPFTQNDGLGRLIDDYRDYPDFADGEMNRRHVCLNELRNNFFAHSSILGIKLELIPPNVPNPKKHQASTVWDFNIGKRLFSWDHYRPLVEWAFPVIPAFMERLEADIQTLLQKMGPKYKITDKAFPLDTGADAWNWPFGI